MGSRTELQTAVRNFHVTLQEFPESLQLWPLQRWYQVPCTSSQACAENHKMISRHARGQSVQGNPVERTLDHSPRLDGHTCTCSCCVLVSRK